MTLAIRLNGVDYDGFTDAQVERDIEAAASSFAFATTATSDNFIPIREGDKVEIIVDNDHKILTGYVDDYDLQYNKEMHTILIKGRSLTEDIIDCSVPNIIDYDKIDLFSLAKKVADHFNITVINNVGKFKDFEFIIGSETGQTSFDFLEPFARARQTLLTDDVNGNLVLTRSSGILSPIELKSIIGSNENNIKKGSRRVSTSELYHTYIAQTQEYPIDWTEVSDYTAEEKIEELGVAIDDEIRSTRVLDFYTEEFTDIFTLEDRAKWEMSIRRARNFLYSCTVQGHSTTDGDNPIIWQPNIIHQIDDDFANLHGQYFCKKVLYKYDLTNGSETELIFTIKNAYTLESEKDKFILEDI